MEGAWDGVIGRELELVSVRKARQEQIEYFCKMEVYTEVPIEECIRVTKKQPIGVR